MNHLNFQWFMMIWLRTDLLFPSSELVTQAPHPHCLYQLGGNGANKMQNDYNYECFILLSGRNYDDYYKAETFWMSMNSVEMVPLSEACSERFLQVLCGSPHPSWLNFLNAETQCFNSVCSFWCVNLTFIVKFNIFGFHTN